jgi:hypothetical protein
MQRTASPDAEVDGGGGAAAHFFSKKDVQVDWDKVSRVAPLVDQALGDMSKEPTVVANARKLEKFYPHLVRWDVTRSKSVRSPRRVCVCAGVGMCVLRGVLLGVPVCEPRTRASCRL